MRAVAGPEGILDEEVGESGKSDGKGWVVLSFAPRPAKGFNWENQGRYCATTGGIKCCVL